VDKRGGAKKKGDNKKDLSRGWGGVGFRCREGRKESQITAPPLGGRAPFDDPTRGGSSVEQAKRKSQGKKENEYRRGTARRIYQKRRTKRSPRWRRDADGGVGKKMKKRYRESWCAGRKKHRGGA